MNKSSTIQFLELYEQRPCLWDSREFDYRNQTIRTAALKSIIEEMGLSITVDELKTKIKNIRTTYNREATKVANSMRSGDPNDVYTPQLIWFPVADRFLKQIVEGRLYNTDNTPKSNKDSAAASDTSSCFDDAGQEYNDEPVQKKRMLYPKIKMECVQTMDEDEMMDPLNYQPNRLKFETPQNNRHDEFDTFGQHVANQLRGLPLENAIICENFINNYLSQERLKALQAQKSSYSKPTSSNQ